MIGEKKIILLILIICVSVSFFLLFSGYKSAWNLWNLPVSFPHFEDVRMITVGSESYALGFNPLYDNPQEPINKKLNYPRIWHLLFELGINQSHTQLIGTIFVFMFFSGLTIFLFSGKFDNLAVIIIGLVTLSPAIMLGIERGNIELVIFFILSLALIAGNSSSIRALSLLLFTAILKLYPVFTFLYLLKENKRKFWLLLLSACGLFIIYIFFTLDDVRQIYLTSPKFAKISYGLNVFWMGLTHPRILNLDLSESVITTVRTLSYLLLGIVFIGALIFSVRTYEANKYQHGQYLDAFRIGAGIYIGCFILGNNFDYRFIFLIFVIPQLVSWLRSAEKKYPSLPLIMLSAVVFSSWNYGIKHIIGMKAGFILEELSNWILMSGLVYLFLASAPAWFTHYTRRLLFFKNHVDRQSVANR